MIPTSKIHLIKSFFDNAFITAPSLAAPLFIASFDRMELNDPDARLERSCLGVRASLSWSSVFSPTSVLASELFSSSLEAFVPVILNCRSTNQSAHRCPVVRTEQVTQINCSNFPSNQMLLLLEHQYDRCHSVYKTNVRRQEGISGQRSKYSRCFALSTEC